MGGDACDPVPSRGLIVLGSNPTVPVRPGIRTNNERKRAERMISATSKNEAMADHRRHEKDCGSPEIQIAILTARIKEVAGHMREHKHDFHSRRGLVQMVAKRNRLLRYLRNTKQEIYLDTIKKLGLRK